MRRRQMKYGAQPPTTALRREHDRKVRESLNRARRQLTRLVARGLRPAHTQRGH